MEEIPVIMYSIDKWVGQIPAAMMGDFYATASSCSLFSSLIAVEKKQFDHYCCHNLSNTLSLVLKKKHRKNENGLKDDDTTVESLLLIFNFT